MEEPLPPLELGTQPGAAQAGGGMSTSHSAASAGSASPRGAAVRSEETPQSGATTSKFREGTTASRGSSTSGEGAYAADPLDSPVAEPPISGSAAVSAGRTPESGSHEDHPNTLHRAAAGAAEAVSARDALLSKLRQQAKRVAARGRSVSATANNLARTKGVDKLLSLMVQLRDATLAVVETIVAWRAALVEAEGEASGAAQAPFVVRGGNYLVTMLHDLDFLADVAPLVAALGLPRSTLVGNPFMLPRDDASATERGFDGEDGSGRLVAAEAILRHESRGPATPGQGRDAAGEGSRGSDEWERAHGGEPQVAFATGPVPQMPLPITSAAPRDSTSGSRRGAQKGKRGRRFSSGRRKRRPPTLRSVDHGGGYGYGSDMSPLDESLRRLEIGMGVGQVRAQKPDPYLARVGLDRDQNGRATRRVGRLTPLALKTAAKTYTSGRPGLSATYGGGGPKRHQRQGSRQARPQRRRVAATREAEAVGAGSTWPPPGHHTDPGQGLGSPSQPAPYVDTMFSETQESREPAASGSPYKYRSGDQSFYGADASRVARADAAPMDAGEAALGERDEDEWVRDVLMVQVGVRPAVLAQLAALDEPPPTVVLVAVGVLILLTEGRSVPADLSWPELRSAFADTADFARRLDEFDATKIAPFKLRALKPFIASRSFSPVRLRHESAAGLALCVWMVRAIKNCPNYHKHVGAAAVESLAAECDAVMPPVDDAQPLVSGPRKARTSPQRETGAEPRTDSPGRPADVGAKGTAPSSLAHSSPTTPVKSSKKKKRRSRSSTKKRKKAHPQTSDGSVAGVVARRTLLVPSTKATYVVVEVMPTEDVEEDARGSDSTWMTKEQRKGKYTGGALVKVIDEHSRSVVGGMQVSRHQLEEVADAQARQDRALPPRERKAKKAAEASAEPKGRDGEDDWIVKIRRAAFRACLAVVQNVIVTPIPDVSPETAVAVAVVRPSPDAVKPASGEMTPDYAAEVIGRHARGMVSRKRVQKLRSERAGDSPSGARALQPGEEVDVNSYRDLAIAEAEAKRAQESRAEEKKADDGDDEADGTATGPDAEDGTLLTCGVELADGGGFGMVTVKADGSGASRVLLFAVERPKAKPKDPAPLTLSVDAPEQKDEDEGQLAATALGLAQRLGVLAADLTSSRGSERMARLYVSGAATPRRSPKQRTPPSATSAVHSSESKAAPATDGAEPRATGGVEQSEPAQSPGSTRAKHRAGSILRGKKVLMTAAEASPGLWEVDVFDSATNQKSTLRVSASDGNSAVERARAQLAPHREGKLIDGERHVITARPSASGKADAWDVESFEATSRQTRSTSVSATSGPEAVRAATPTLSSQRQGHKK